MGMPYAGGLAGPRLGLGDHVPPLQQEPDGGLLHRRGGLVPQVVQGTQDGRVQAELAEAFRLRLRLRSRPSPRGLALVSFWGHLPLR